MRPFQAPVPSTPQRYTTVRLAHEVIHTTRVKEALRTQDCARDRFSSVTRPVKELKGFRRVFLEPGETATVEFEIKPELLAFYDVRMKRVVEPGEFEIMVGNSSRDTDLETVILTVS